MRENTDAMHLVNANKFKETWISGATDDLFLNTHYRLRLLDIIFLMYKNINGY